MDYVLLIVALYIICMTLQEAADEIKQSEQTGTEAAANAILYPFQLIDRKRPRRNTKHKRMDETEQLLCIAVLIFQVGLAVRCSALLL